MNFPWEEGVLIFAVDPAQRVSAVAWKGVSAETKRNFAGTRRVGDILDSHEMEQIVRSVSEKAIYTRVWLVVEYPTWNAGASPVVRAAANTWIRLFRRIFPSGTLDVVRVDPNKWQGALGFRDRQSRTSTKDHSLFLAQKVYGWAVEGDPDRADASLILEWVRSNPPQPKVKKPRKKRANT